MILKNIFEPKELAFFGHSTASFLQKFDRNIGF
jgi:hypothetical protein